MFITSLTALADKLEGSVRIPSRFTKNFSLAPIIAASNSSMPRFFLGFTCIIGTFKNSSIFLISIAIPFFCARSTIVKAIRTGFPRSITCVTYSRFLGRLVASATSIYRSISELSTGFMSVLYETHSSARLGYRLYEPGRSWIIAFLLRRRILLPLFISTVTPGKFPTFWFNPVIQLKREVFPLFGLPNNAICNSFFKSQGESQKYAIMNMIIYEKSKNVGSIKVVILPKQFPFTPPQIINLQ